MNTDDPFEQQLQQWAQGLPRHDPTPAWKQDILHAAATRPTARPRASRYVMIACTAMWTLALLFRITTPANPIPPGPMLSSLHHLTPDQLFATLLP